MLIVRRKAPVSGVFLFFYPWMSVYGEELMFLVWVLCLFVWLVSALFVDASCSIAYFFGLVLFCSGWFSWVLFCLFFLIFLKCAFHGSTFRLAGDRLASSGQKSSTRRQGEPGSWGNEETRLEAGGRHGHWLRVLRKVEMWPGSSRPIAKLAALPHQGRSSFRDGRRGAKQSALQQACSSGCSTLRIASAS